LAISKNIAIVLLVEFQERKVANESDVNKNTDDVQIPKIVEVARFQLYNPIISFSVRRTNDRDIDIFWVTQKSLERCTIDKESMKELKLAGRNVRSSNIRATRHYESLTSVTPVFPIAAPPKPQLLSQMDKSPFAKNGTQKPVFTPQAPLQPTAYVTPPAPRPTPINVTPVSSTGPNVLQHAVSKEQELMSKIENATRDLNKMKRSSDAGLKTTPSSSTAVVSPNKSLVSAQDLSHNLMGISLGHGSNFQPLPMSYPSPFGNAMAMPPANFAAIARTQEGLDNRIAAFENKFEGQFKNFSDFMQRSLGQLSADITSVRVNRDEMVARDQRLTEAVVEKVVNKSMLELNTIVADGLKDFFQQVKNEVDDLSANVVKTKSNLDQSLKEVADQMSGLQEKMDIFQKQLEKNEAEQQLAYLRMIQQQQLNAAAAALGQSPYSYK
jgi:hypothetical protein